MKRLCVFCGSSHGRKTIFTEMARALGAAMAQRKIGLVYGGGDVGLMGEIANAVLQAGGEVIGVIPKTLAIKEVAHNGLTEMHIVENMLERKALMAELSDGFIALPGGYGTLDELFEMLTWTQLGIHAKPCAILDVENYYKKLLEFLDQMVEQQFLKPPNREMLLVETDPNVLLNKLENYKVRFVKKWVHRG
ncbi:MAG: TIGR00730 family Rossman fold protein [bacterium]